MTAEDLKNSILQLAVEGKLVPQDPGDEPAALLLKSIDEEKAQLIRNGKIRREKNPSRIFHGNDNLLYEQVGYNEPVCIADEVTYDIPNTWEMVRLSSVCQLVDGQKISNKRLPLMDAKFLRKKGETKYNNEGKFVAKGEKLILVDGENSGEVFTAPQDGYMGSTFKILWISSELNISYLMYFIELYRLPLKNNKKGAAIPHLNKDIFYNLFFPLPPLAEQKRIVEKIEQLIPLVEEYGAKETELNKLQAAFPENLKKSVLQEAVQGKLVPQDPGDEPAAVLLKKIRAEKQKMVSEGKIKKEKHESQIMRRGDSYFEKIDGKEHCIDDEIPFEIPDTWEWARLKNIVFNHGQKTPVSKFSYIDIGSIDNKHQSLNSDETILNAEKAPSRARKIIKEGDIIYSTVRPYLHNMCIINKKFSCEPIASTGFAVLSCYNGIKNKYLFYFMLSPEFDSYANDNENSKGVAYPAINDDRLYKALVPLPPLAEQKRIVDKIEEIMPHINNLSA